MPARLLIFVLLAAGADAAAQPVPAEERAVIEAALEARGVGKHARVTIANRTATFSCSLSREELIQLEGCSGMRPPQETAEQVMARLKGKLAAPDEALADLRAKNEKAAVLDKPFASLKSQQAFWGPRKDMKRSQLARPDLAVAVSRVGFDKPRRHAVVYVATMSWTDPKGSYGEYVLLEKSGARWKPAKSLRMWQLGR